MAAKPALTNESIALTEKKIDMTLDDIIKMSKKPVSKGKNAMIANKNRGFINNGTSQTRASNLKRFADSRSTLRQGVLAQRRSNFKADTQFPLAVEAAQKVTNEPVRMRVPNWRRTRSLPDCETLLDRSTVGWSLVSVCQKIRLLRGYKTNHWEEAGYKT